MRKFITALILVLLLGASANAAFLFDGSDYISLADNAALSLPDGPWTVCVRIKFTSRTGTTVRDIWHWETGTPFFRLRIGDAGAGVAPDDINVTITDNDGTSIAFSTSNDPFASNTSDTSVCLQRSGTTVTVYVNGVSNGSGSNAAINGVDVAANFILGNNGPSVGNTATFLGSMTDFAKWDTALSVDQMASFAKGFSANCYLNPLKVYVQGIREYQELHNGIAVTNSGTTVTDQPRILYCGSNM